MWLLHARSNRTKYAYAANNPYRFYDPTGLAPNSLNDWWAGASLEDSATTSEAPSQTIGEPTVPAIQGFIIGGFRAEGLSGAVKGMIAYSDAKDAYNESIGLNSGVVELGLIAGPSAVVEAYEVGRFAELAERSVVGDALDIHHVGQAHAMEQLVEGYSRIEGPAIALPQAEHALIPNLRGTVELTPRQVLAQDIWNLRRYTNAPNSSLQEVIRLNKEMYPGAFAR